MTDKMRDEFEKSPRFRGMDFTRSATHPDYYNSPYANGAWDGWKAAKEVDGAVRNPEPSPLKFSERLAYLRATQGLTQRELAAATGLSGSMISRYEAGECRPRLKAIFALEKALGCPGQFQGASHD